MTEVCSMILGAVLATAGGIIGSFITDWIQKRKEREDKKLEAYITILNFLHVIKFAKYSEKEVTYKSVAEVTTLGKLYGSEKVQKGYDLVQKAIVELYEYEFESDQYNKQIGIVNSLINVLTAQIKKETNLSDRNSEELLKLTFESKENKNAN